MLLQLEKIHRSYDLPGSRSHREILRDLDLEVEEGRDWPL